MPTINRSLAVERGAKLLDERHPDWVGEVNLDDLEMDSIFQCILGQIYGSFAAGMEELFGEDDLNIHDQLAFEHGFDADWVDEHDYHRFQELHAAWEEEIEERRGQS